MADFMIDAELRSVIGKKVSRLRRAGLVPAIVYGPELASRPLQIPYRPLELLLMKAGGTNLIDIQLGEETCTALTRDVQRDILRGDILHVDFFAPRMDQLIATEVFLRFTGESPAVATGQGILITGPGSLTIETLPTHLRSEIEIDVSELTQIGDSIHVRDIDLGEGTRILTDPDELLVRVVQPAAVAAEEDEDALGDEEVAEVDAASVERVGEEREEE